MAEQFSPAKSSPSHSSPASDSGSTHSFTTVVTPAQLRSSRARGGGPSNVPRRNPRNTRSSEQHVDQQKYLADLMLELNRMNNLCDSPSSVNIDFHHLRRLLILEIARVVGQSPQPPPMHASVSPADHDKAASCSKQEMTGNGKRSPTKEHRLSNTDEINKLIKTIPGLVEVEQVKKGAVVMQSKIQVPREPREYNYIGRILGPRGISVRRLETETSTSIFIRGRGSLKDPEEERRLRGTAQGQHLNEDLHIIIRAVAPDEYDCAEKLRVCAEKISQLLKPDFDEYKRQQLVQLAIINGTYRP